jgi:hypothetical protein
VSAPASTYPGACSETNAIALRFEVVGLPSDIAQLIDRLNARIASAIGLPAWLLGNTAKP